MGKQMARNPEGGCKAPKKRKKETSHLGTSG